MHNRPPTKEERKERAIQAIARNLRKKYPTMSEVEAKNRAQKTLKENGR